MDDVQSLGSVVPHLSLENIIEWYDTFVLPRSSTFLAEEAKSSMLWKLMTLKALKHNRRSELSIVYIREGSSLSGFSRNDIELLCHSSKFICVNERLLENIDFDQSDWVRKTCSILTPEQSKMLIDHLERLVVQNFWKDIGLPYPAVVRHIKCFLVQPEPPTFQQTDRVVRDQLEKCLKPVYCRSPWRNLYLDDGHCADYAISDLRDSIGCLLCFSELWSAQSVLTSLSEELARFSTYYIHMYKYMKLLKTIRSKWINASNKKVKREFSRRWWNFPVDTHDEKRTYICLSKFEVADSEMDRLYSLLFP